jgi:hypothetical protein
MDERKRTDKATQIAQGLFCRTNPDKEPDPWWLPPAPLDGDVYIVTAWFVESHPRPRFFWRVNVDTQSVEELVYGDTFEEPTELISTIEAAFDGVPKPHKMTLRVARAADDYVPEEEWSAIRALDSEARWQDVADTDLEEHWDVHPFFDAPAFRYYIPAFLVWAIRHYTTMDYHVEGMTLWSLKPENEQLQLLTEEQRYAITQFLKFGAMAFDDFDAQEAAVLYEGYWKQYEKESAVGPAK